jgi:UTP--glucose-1-phosphate uridylyltransferase
MSRIRKAIFPVAGLGTRFLPATKAVPKELLTLVDRPLIDYAIAEARAAGIEQFIFVTAAGKEAIEAHVTSNFALEQELALKGKTDAMAAVAASALPEGAAVFVRQDRPLGLGHAVFCARSIIGKEPFDVLLPDDVILADEP